MTEASSPPALALGWIERERKGEAFNYCNNGSTLTYSERAG